LQSKHMLHDKNILLIISGGIAAYKSLDLIRQLRKYGAHVRAILTKGGEQFVTPLSVASLTEEQVYTDLWSLKDETEMGHIRLSREADLIVIAPASADLIAKMAHGQANDLASTTLLAADKDILIAPAMNHKMWEHPATQQNIQTLKDRGILQVGPDYGDMACGETGYGRMSDPTDILAAIVTYFNAESPLAGYRALVTSGPTYEHIDPVRFIGNHSSGKQGHAIATALKQAGANVTLVAGPVNLPDPSGVNTIHVTSASDMKTALEENLPADIAVCAAAPSDWQVAEASSQKLKKNKGSAPPNFNLVETPDLLHMISTHAQRPELVIGFAAETENLTQNASEKLHRKKCDWILGNDVSGNKVFGKDTNHIHFVTKEGSTDWGSMTKQDIAYKLVQHIEEHLKENEHTHTHAAE
jgi:phosphopantothenoylcysteine decarboxylase / phosphopantothenate---cysteine ligase